MNPDGIIRKQVGHESTPDPHGCLAELIEFLRKAGAHSKLKNEHIRKTVGGTGDARS